MDVVTFVVVAMVYFFTIVFLASIVLGTVLPIGIVLALLIGNVAAAVLLIGGLQ